MKQISDADSQSCARHASGDTQGKTWSLRGWRWNECCNKQVSKTGEAEAVSLDCLTTLVRQKRFSPVKQAWASAWSPHWLRDSKSCCLKWIPCYKPNYFENHLLEAILKSAKIQVFPRL